MVCTLCTRHRWIFLQHIRFPSTFTLHSKGQFPSTFYYINVENWRFPTTVNNDFIRKFIQVWAEVNEMGASKCFILYVY